MAEYIEREAAEECILGRVEWFDWEVKAAIRAIPAADVVPVVRCGDCENWQSGWKPSAAKDGTHFCAYVGLCTSADWFCADGARMDGDRE